MSDAGSPRLAAPAKLNLWLRVVGRRPDGYHQLDSLLVLLELADVVTVAPDGPDLEVGGRHAAGVPEDRTNLAWRGWAAGWANEAVRGGLVVDKQIPVAAGLGGGSSDAAAAWRLAVHARGQSDAPGDGQPGERPDAETLAALVAVGADVPFFAAQVAAARVTGIGEIVERVPAPPVAQDVVLVHPPFGLSTAAVFAELTPADWSTAEDGPLVGPGRNDLLPAARRLRSELDDLFRVVAAAGGEPHLTGSGPTVFILTDDPERADGVARRVESGGLAATRTRLRPEPASIETW